MLSSEFIDKFAQVARSPEPDLATAALLIARLEYPRLDASHYLDRLDLMGRAAADRLEHETGENPRRQIAALNGYLFDEEGFDGNQKHYDDPRKQLPERGARPPQWDPGNAGAGVHGSGPARRPAR